MYPFPSTSQLWTASTCSIIRSPEEIFLSLCSCIERQKKVLRVLDTFARNFMSRLNGNLLFAALSLMSPRCNSDLLMCFAVIALLLNALPCLCFFLAPASCRREPEHGKRHQQPGAVAHALPEEAGARGRAVPDGSAAPCHPRRRPPAAYHPDEVCRGLRLQGGVRGRMQPGCHHHCPPP